MKNTIFILNLCNLYIQEKEFEIILMCVSNNNIILALIYDGCQRLYNKTKRKEKIRNDPYVYIYLKEQKSNILNQGNTQNLV